MFDKKSFEDGIELGKRLGKSEALFHTWLYDLSDLNQELIHVIFNLKDENLNRSDICDAVLEAVNILKDKVNKEHNKLSYGGEHDKV